MSIVGKYVMKQPVKYLQLIVVLATGLLWASICMPDYLIELKQGPYRGDGDKRFLEEWGREGVEIARKHYTWSNQAENLLSFIRQLKNSAHAFLRRSPPKPI